MKRRRLFRLTLLALIAAGTALFETGGVGADNRNGQVIQASLDFAANRITIIGSHLPKRPSVLLGGTDLGEPLRASATQIVASLANVAGIENEPGDYLLAICGPRSMHGSNPAEEIAASGRDANGARGEGGYLHCNTTFIVTIGAAGPEGPQGPKGEKGDRGDTGPQGLPGEKGDTGPQGVPGAKGDKGDPGLQGVPGAKGDKGDPGPQGFTGAQGATGPQGIPGVLEILAGRSCSSGAYVTGFDASGNIICSSSPASCPNRTFTFGMMSTEGSTFTGANWPGGSETQFGPAGCSVSARRPSGNVSLVGALGDRWQITGRTGYSSCFGVGGEDGDGVATPNCSQLTASFGSVQDGRPSCSNSLCTFCSGVATDTFTVQCVQ